MPATAGTWPVDLTREQVATFTRWGWTAQDWHDEDSKVAIRFGPSIVPVDTPTQRNQLTLREWLRNPPASSVAPIPRDLIGQVVAAHGPRLTSNVLDAYAAGAPHAFLDVILAKRPGQTGWPQRNVITAWEITVMASLTGPAAIGWATTGELNAPILKDGTTAKEGRVVADQIIAWTDQFGPDAYLYVLAGITLKEALGLAAAGKTPTEQQLRVMAALNGHTLPAGV